ncbi:MAG: hypothetical protein VYE68_05910, partial [Acidobacteriota bacterium]|nr:hypothetical protein [Acidobacteriota bacterium]
PMGMLLAVPLTMILKIAFENTTDLRWIAVLLDANPSTGPSVKKPRETDVPVVAATPTDVRRGPQAPTHTPVV